VSKTYLGPLLISRSYGGPSSWCCVNHLIDTHVTTVNRFYNTLNYYSSVNPIAYWCCMNYNSIKSENGNLTTIVFPSLLTAKCCISAPCCEHPLPCHVCHPKYKGGEFSSSLVNPSSASSSIWVVSFYITQIATSHLNQFHTGAAWITTLWRLKNLTKMKRITIDAMV
jgi:hypothetical protein